MKTSSGMPFFFFTDSLNRNIADMRTNEMGSQIEESPRSVSFRFSRTDLIR